MISVWSPFIRIFHWTLVTIVISDLWINEEGGDWHSWLGYVAVSLIGIRLLYGFFGNSYSRWKTFVQGPRATFQYFKLSLSHQEPRMLTHNPLAAYGMISMLIVICGLGLSGYLLEETDRFFGDEQMQGIHEFLSQALIGLIVIHLLGLILHTYRHKEILVFAMIKGTKEPLDKP